MGFPNMIAFWDYKNQIYLTAILNFLNLQPILLEIPLSN